ncbi:hypothetical protein Trco_001922 [Trichoderma cornu-damae]|uniref:Altered inheritance of mitochondria protein 21 n=1 Tax=Trichoderma cornu-damae TaxID=654480 RepID=A0A9P8QLM9_9HYPO|nr:hypothetical protein Trco_001922 [Trichoderma cornu-damae]
MAAPTMQQPVVPPRPSKSPAKDLSAAGPSPLVPPRPGNKRIDRSRSPNPDRFAQSPFADGVIPVSPLGGQLSPSGGNGGSREALDHPESVSMPSVGEEGLEYSVITSELQAAEGTESAEQTRTVAQDLKLHAPKPSLPASSAKERVKNVTHTDSDKAASFGIGKPGYLEGRSTSRNGLRKKSSTSFSATSEQDHQTDDEHGIPEIGQRVPMNPHLGDVQAPSPAPTSDGNGKNHSRRHSSRGLPPGSYGMHGHGVESQDELDKAYYKKHPELLQREHHTPLHDRQNDFAMSSSDLNKLVRDTANRKSGIDFNEHHGTPNDEVAFQAHEEYASRMATPRPLSMVSKDGGAPLEDPGASEDQPIHVDDPKHPEQYSYGAESPVESHGNEFDAPILAADEIEKDVARPAQHPAVRPHLDRNSSSYDGTSRPTSRPASRPTSRPTSIYNAHANHTPLEDVREYEPLFPDEAAKKEEEKREKRENSKARHYFPSKDVWEDAPTSVHYTAEVSTPDNSEEDQQRRKSSTHLLNRPITPAQAFAMQQEELAEKEADGKKHNFLPILEHKPSWVDHQPHLKSGKPSTGNRFPSKDVWEDTPESLLHEAEVEEKPKDEKKPEVPARPSKKLTELLSHKPAVPERLKSRQQTAAGGEDAPKPAIPTRPVKKVSADAKDGEPSKPKPPVPSRPVGGKIAAMQAGFMSDLNKRLQLGPQPSKKEEAEKNEVAQDKEKVLLSDARKGRARGPQRRAPTKSPAPDAAPDAAPASAKEASPISLSLSQPQTIWNIDPERGDVHVASDSLQVPVKEIPEAAVESEQLPPPPIENEKPAELEKPTAEEERDSEPSAQALEPEAPKESVEPAASTKPAESEAVLVPEPLTEPEEPKDIESAKEPETAKEAEEPKEPGESGKPEEVKNTEEPVKEETLAANAAGESVLEAKVEQKDDDDTKEIEPVEAKDEVKS